MNLSKLVYIRVIAMVTLLICVSMGSAYATRTDEAQAILDAGISAGKPSYQKAVKLWPVLNDGDPSNDFLLVDVRSATDYANGHIAGAINIPFEKLASTRSLAILDAAIASYGGNRILLAYHNTEHESGMAETVLRMLGYTATSLRYGLASWTENKVAAPERYIPCTKFDSIGHGIAPAGCNKSDFPVDTKIVAPGSGKGIPAVDNTSSTDPKEMVRVNADLWLSKAPANNNYRMTADQVYDILDDNQDGVLRGPGDDPSNDPQIISNRLKKEGSSNCYQNGHIPGSIGIKRPTENQQENQTEYLDPTKTIVHNCWTGHSQQQLVPMAGILGFNIFSLDYGLNGWTTNNVAVKQINLSKEYGRSYTVEVFPTVIVNTTDSKGYITVHIISGHDASVWDVSSLSLSGGLKIKKSSVNENDLTLKIKRKRAMKQCSDGKLTISVSGDSSELYEGKPVLTMVGSDTVTCE